MKTAVVVTTIFHPSFIDRYLKNFKDNNVNTKDISFIIVGDNKSQPETAKLAKTDKCFEYWDVEKQKKHLKDVPEHYSYLIPENNGRRRNFGYLLAQEYDVDNVIVIDDDNFPTDDWYNGHINALYKDEHKVVYSRNNIINPCVILEYQDSGIPYFRGYPINEWYNDSFDLSLKSDTREVKLNMGLWSYKPDVDAISNLLYPSMLSKNIKLDTYKSGRNNYFPVNTQNTSYKKSLIPLFHNIYQETLFDLPLSRYDDIFNGLFLMKLINKMDNAASFGCPLVSHERNNHDYVKDLSTEIVGNAIGCKIWKYIMNKQLESKSYVNAYLELANGLVSDFENGNIYTSYVINKFMGKIGKSMIDWIELGELMK
jgi:hypothetical protein